MNCNIKSLYICVKDMDRAVAFYEQPVTKKDDIYSVFDIEGFRFGLFAYEKKNENIGKNRVVEVIDSEGNHIEVTAPA